MVIKGQNLRLKVDGKVLAMAQSCSVQKTANIEEISSKDSTGGAAENGCTGTSWNASANGVVAIDSADTAAQQGFDLLDLVGTTVDIEFVETEGEKNRAEKSGGVKKTGKAIVADCSLEFPNRQNSTYSISLTGTGELS